MYHVSSNNMERIILFHRQMNSKEYCGWEFN